MNLLLYTPAAGFRSEGKCFSISGKLLLLALCCVLLLTEVVCHPPDETFEAFDVGDDYGEVDNVEWHHVKAVNGVMQEDHPIIMYKEDFVNEDYDPSKNKTGDPTNSALRPLRQYKDTTHRRRRLNRTKTHAELYRTQQPEKIYFDVLPQAPLMVSDDSTSNDSKFDPSKIRVEVISLLDGDQSDNSAQEEPSKQLLSKHPKKYHRRLRRDLEAHTVAKRTPFYRYDPPENRLFYPTRSPPSNNGFDMEAKPIYHRYHVQGDLYMTPNDPVPFDAKEAPEIPVIDQDFVVDTRLFPDRVVWGSRTSSNVPRVRPTQAPQQEPAANAPAPRPQNLPPLDLFHNSSPDNADFSFITARPQQFPRTTPAPQTQRPPLELFHDSNPDNADFSFMTRPQPSKPPQRQFADSAPPRRPTARPMQGASQGQQMPKCVWAIVMCCSSRDYNVRYNCFEQYSCTGAFWDRNPCTDEIRENVINYINEYY